MKTFTRNSPSIKSSSSWNDQPEQFITIAVKTFTNRPTKRLDLSTVNSQADLDTLKSQDPFMYYSIPGVRSAKMLFNDDMDIDTTRLSEAQDGESVRRRSCPDRIETTIDDESDSSSDESSCAPSAPQEEPQCQRQAFKKVTRETRISFECHPDLLLEDILDEIPESECELQGDLLNILGAGLDLENDLAGDELEDDEVFDFIVRQ